MTRACSLIVTLMLLGMAVPTQAADMTREPEVVTKIKPQVTGITFVCINVPDQDAALAWYRTAFDVTPAIDMAYQINGVDMRWLAVKFPAFDGPMIVLNKIDHELEKKMGLPESGPVSNILFDVNDCDGLAAHLKDVGATILEEPTTYQWGRECLFADPWGNMFVMVAPPAPEAGDTPVPDGKG